MRTQHLMVAFVMLLAIFGTSIITNTHGMKLSSLNEGLVAYYSFDDGTATDNSNNGNNGEIFATTSIMGVKGKALRFDGSSSYVRVPHAPSLNFKSAFTICGWVNINAPDPDGYIPILTKGNESTLATPYAIVYHLIFDNDIAPHVRFTSADEINIVTDLPLEHSLLLQQWSFFVWRYQSGKLEIYRDRVKIGEQELGINELADSDLPLEIGRDIPGVTEFLNGDLDEVRMYNRAISSDEIQQLYQQVYPFAISLPLIRQ